MGAYALAGVLAVMLLALVLWIGGPETPRCDVELAVDSPWTAAVLDDGRAQRALRAGERIEAPPGAYTLTLLDDDGGSEVRVLQVAGPLTTIR
jgi:hypothetical protein